MVPTNYYVILSAVLFGLGVIAFIFKRNIISIFMSIELMLNAVNLAFVAFSQSKGNLDGQIFVLFVIIVAAAEAAVGLGIIILIPGYFRAGFDLQMDQLTVVMLLVVTGVGWLIHIYSTGYMAHEGGYYRFFSYLNLFMFFMLILVLAANYVLLFVGWEGVGLSSYLLIGFYFLRKSASDAGRKAFIVNRIGDFGFMLGMFLLFRTFHTLDFTALFQAASNPGWSPEGWGQFGTFT